MKIKSDTWTYDFELAKRASNGDDEAFTEIFKKYYDRVYSLCLRMMKNRSDAEDLTQDVFMQLQRKIKSYRGESAFTTWLHTFTRNQVLMHFRRNHVKLERTIGEENMPDQIVTGTSNPNRMRIVDNIALDQAIKQLPKGYRDHLMLHDIDGYNHEEIALRLGSSIGTSKSQVHKARLKMKKLLNKKANPRIIGYSIPQPTSTKPPPN